MAGTTSISVTYAGEASAEVISAALLAGKTLSEENVTIVDGIKYKQAIQKLDMSNLLQAGGCDWNDAGATAWSEAILEPKQVRVNKEECVLEYLPHWYSAKMKAGRNNDDMSPFNEFLIREIGNNVGQDTELLIWRGDATGSTGGYLDILDGFLTLFDANLASGNTVTLTAFTKSNMLSNMEAVYDEVPEAILSKGNFVMYMNRKSISKYLQNLAEQGDRTTETEGSYSYLDTPIKETPGIPDNQIVIAEPSNLFVGTDLLSDLNEVSIIDRRAIDGSDNFRYVLKAQLDTAVGYYSEVIYGQV